MRRADLVMLALSALWQQKTRTVLTLFGVVLGTLILTVSVSVGQGVLAAVIRHVSQFERLRRIEVFTQYQQSDDAIPAKELEVRGTMSDARRQRLRKALARRWHRRNAAGSIAPLTRQRLDELAGLDHVVSAVPWVFRHGETVYAGQAQESSWEAVPADSPGFQKRIVAGDWLTSDDGREVVVHEMLLYSWGFRDEADVPGVVGKKVRLRYQAGQFGPVTLPGMLSSLSFGLTPDVEAALRRGLARLPEVFDKIELAPDELAALERVFKGFASAKGPAAKSGLVEDEFTVVGVLREAGPDDATPGELIFRTPDPDVALPVRSGLEFTFRGVPPDRQWIERVTLTVDRDENVKEVVEQVEAMGLHQFSLVEFVDHVRTNLLLVNYTLSFVAAIALLVAALGITNTMLMAVLERTHEIGVMKAVGARDGHIQFLFLVEGALIGLVGGALGVALGWTASLPGNGIVRSLVEQQVRNPVTGSMFVYPWWLVLGVPAFAAAVTTLAAVYPARRAARVDPVVALRHE